MNLAGKTALVTGATGLIGAEVVTALEAAGCGVISAVRDPSRARGRAIFYDAEQALDFDFAVDFVVHAASGAHPLAYARDPAGVMRQNVYGTMNLLDYARDMGARLLFLSSGEVYGLSPAPEAGFPEDFAGILQTMDPRACYPESKRCAEAMVASWKSQYGTDALVARLCHIYGPSISPANSRADAQFLRDALAGRDILMKSAGDQVRSFLYAKDAARAILLLLERGEAGRAYNVAGRSVHSIREYAGTLAEVAGVKLKFENPDDLEKAGYSKVRRAVLDPTLIESLGFRAEYGLERGLRETYERCRGDRGISG